MFLNKLNAKRQHDLGTMIDESREKSAQKKAAISPINRHDVEQVRDQVSQRRYNLTEITEKTRDDDTSPGRGISRAEEQHQSAKRLEVMDKPKPSLDDDVQEDVKAILSSAARNKNQLLDDEASFYTNALDALDQSPLASNNKRFNQLQQLDDAIEIGRQYESGASRGGEVSSTSFQPPADHALSEAMKKQHERTRSKANADLVDELDIRPTQKNRKTAEDPTAKKIHEPTTEVPRIDQI